VTLDTRGMVREVRAWAEEVFEEAVLDLASQLDETVPVGETTRLDGPALRDTQQVEVHGLQATIRYAAEHASYTDEGTPPHPIVGNPLLAFRIDGELVIVHSVQHPGTPRTGWFSDTVTEQAFAEALDRAASQVAF
jgi:hypothetical protein